MATPIEIPVRVANLEQAVVEIQKLTDATKKGASDAAKELGEVDKLLRKNLSAEFASQAINRLSNHLEGAQKQVAGLVSSGVAGFGAAGPWGAAVGVAISGIEILLDRTRRAREEMLRLRQSEADVSQVLRDNLVAAEDKAQKEVRLRETEQELRRRGEDASRAAGIVESEMLDLRASRAREAAEAIESQHDAARRQAQAAEAALKRLGESGWFSSEVADKERERLQKIIDDEKKLGEQRVRLVNELATLEREQSAARERVRREENAAVQKETEARREAIRRMWALNHQLANEALRAEEERQERAAQRRERRLLEREAQEDARRAREREAEEAWAIQRAEIELEAARSIAAEKRRIREEFEQEELRRFVEQQRELADIERDPVDDLAASMTNLAGATASAGIAAGIAGESIGEAIQAQVAASLEGVAIESAVKALEHGAAAIGSAAFGRFDAAAAHGIAAGKYAGVALAAGAGAALMGGSASAPAAGSAGTGATATGPQTSAQATGPRESTIVINAGSGLFMTRDELNRSLKLAIDTHDRRR